MKINILKIDNIEGSLIASLFLRNNSIFSPINPPYIKVPLISKKYTLVLDLDETLVNFKIKSGKEGLLRLQRLMQILLLKLLKKKKNILILFFIDNILLL